MWFRAYLSDRKLYVPINGQQSSLLSVRSGVYQGSILGPSPIYYNIYQWSTNCHQLISYLLSFADDTKCLSAIQSSTDTLNLLIDLYAIEAWSKQWNMTFNESKCIHLCFLSKPNPTAPPSSYLTNNSTSNSHKDLGVIMSNDLSWTEHYHLIISKAYRLIGIIRCTFTSNCVITNKQLYLSLIQSQFTYCSIT